MLFLIIVISFVGNHLPIRPHSPRLLVSHIRVINSLSVGLPVLEVALPVALAEVDPPRPTPLVLDVVAIITDPVALEYLDVLFLYLVFPLGDLRLAVLHPFAVKQSVLELPLVP